MKKTRQSGVTMIEVIIAAVLLAGVFAMTFAILGSTSEATARAQIQLELEDRARRVITEITQELRQTKQASFLLGGGNAGQVALSLSATDSTTQLFNTALAPTGVWMTYPWTDIEFRMQAKDNSGWTTGTFTTAPDTYWNRKIRYRLIMDTGEGGSFTNPETNLGFNSSGNPPRPNNVDNNTNGVVDEQAIERTEQPINGVTGASTGTPMISVICRDVQKNGLQFTWASTGANVGKLGITLTLEKRDPRFKTTITKTVQTFVDLRN
jgi:Tfp pilus assembly protein PilV